MKQSQWLVAVFLLAGMVFVVTFAMNFLGGTPKQVSHEDGSPGPQRRELAFAYRVFPPVGTSRIEQEAKTTGHGDFWFQNPHDTPLKVGLVQGNCKCTKVWIYLMPEDGMNRLLSDATALLGVSPAGPLTAATLQIAALSALTKGAKGTEILKGAEAVDIPAKGLGWVRLDYKGERAGQQQLEAVLWSDDKSNGMAMPLALAVGFHEPLRVNPRLSLGVLKDSDLVAGSTHYLYCWSPTRAHLKLEAKPATPRGEANSDPFEIGTPEQLSGVALEALAREVPNIPTDTPEGTASNLIASGYRIPVTLRSVAKDGKTPFDIGQFRRRVVVSCPDVEMDAKSILVVGQVRGVVELGGGEENAGDLDFRIFSRNQGKRQTMRLTSEVPGVKLEIDPARTWEYLKPTLTADKPIGTLQSWSLRVEVLPGKASGTFPRKDDPAYEDCAVYLKATVPDSKQPPRTIRIAVQGQSVG